MSQAENALNTIKTQAPSSDSSTFVPPAYETPHIMRQMDELMQRVEAAVAPVWPLKDYVAINPFSGISDRRFLNARSYLRTFSDCETLMPLQYYAEEFAAGKFSEADIVTAIAETVEDQPLSGDNFQADAIVARLNVIADESSHDALHGSRGRISKGTGENKERRIRTISETLDRQSGTKWSAIVVDEISKFCSSHYDQGQAAWKNSFHDLPLFQAWKATCKFDANIEVLGLRDFRSFVEGLPHTPAAAIVELLTRMRVPDELWEGVLLCQAYSVIGWSAWAQFQSSSQTVSPDDSEPIAKSANDLAGLIAIRLAYDVAMSEAFAIRIQWESVSRNHKPSFAAAGEAISEDSHLRGLLLRASEIAFRNQLLEQLDQSTQQQAKVDTDNHDAGQQHPPLAQMVFCIDVRSERIRRHLESVSQNVVGQRIETFGFAGFFGLPIEYVSLGETDGSGNVPVLLKPQFKVHEHLEGCCDASLESDLITKRNQIRTFRGLWQRLQGSVLGCFPFVETVGLSYGWKLLRQALGIQVTQSDSRYDGIDQEYHSHLGPSLRGLTQQGISTTEQTNMAESILRGIGLTGQLGRLVVFAGHGSTTENNPLKAGLDCGACGGHTGEPNARFAALLLNQPYVRQGLAERGIAISDETVFVAAMHNTTTDEIHWFDEHLVPGSHKDDLDDLKKMTAIATKANQRERLPLIAGNSIDELLRRSSDWSEVRPEWGLAGNAAFVVGPRSLTQSVSLDGRVFLHSYEAENDTEFAVLEQIMTAPMVVAQWINMQYYASTVDQPHFGSGNKTIHNVVGRFGMLAGGSGDLLTGLPWQSLHDGENYQHQPLRLTAVIAASRSGIEQVIAKHASVANLLINGWLNLIAHDEGKFYRYAEDQSWHDLPLGHNLTEEIIAS